MYLKNHSKQESRKRSCKKILFSLTLISLLSFSINVILFNENNYYKNLSSVQENQKLIQENSYLKNEVTNLQKGIEQINQMYNTQISQLKEKLKDKDIQINNLQQQINFYQSQLQKAQLIVITVYGEIKSSYKISKIEFESGNEEFIVYVKDNSYSIKLINYEIYNVKIYYEVTSWIIFKEEHCEYYAKNWKLDSNEAYYRYDIVFK
jgi:predicted nuclease with TOPRIM domain